MINQMDPTMIIPSRSIQSKKIKPPIESLDKKEDRKGQPSTMKLKASMKDHITSSFQSSKERLGAISHMYFPKTSISIRIQKFKRGFLIIFPLDGYIQGEVVVGRTNGDNLGGSNYLYLFKLIGLAST